MQLYSGLLARLAKRGLTARISGSTLYVDCPFCELRGYIGRDTKQRLGIELNGGRVPKGTSHCFRCNYPKGWSFQRAQTTLQKLLGNSISSLTEEQEKPKETVTELPEDFEVLTGPEEYWTAKAWQYLLQRGMTGQQIKDHGVGFSLLGRTAGRVVFPIYGEKLVGCITLPVLY